MYTSSSELIKNELSNSLIKPIYNIFEDSVIVYNDLVKEKEDIFKGTYINEFKGRLINYIIKRYFDKDKIPQKFPFQVDAVKMPYGQKRTELRRKNIILTIAKIKNWNVLPDPSKYKIKYALGNSTIAKQLMIDLDQEGKGYIDSPYYGIIGYKIENGLLESLNIIIPDDKYTYVIDRVPLTPSLKIVTDIDDENEEERFFKRESIKKEILNNIDKDEIQNH